MSALSPGSPVERRLTVPAETSQLSVLRAHVRLLARRSGADDDLVEQFELAVSELATNVIEHSETAHLTVDFGTLPDRWVIDVSNAEGIAAIDEPTRPDASMLTGRGLFIVHALMDSVELVGVDGYEHIRCTKMNNQFGAV